MKAVIISAIFLGLTAAQNQATWDARTKYCSTTNETTVCAGMENACCGSINTKVGAATNSITNRCIPRNLVDDLPSLSYTAGTVTTTVAYACLNTTRPAGNTAPPRCVNDTQCTSGFCCASMNYTFSQTGQTTKNVTFNECVPGAIGRDAGSVINFLLGHPSNVGTVADMSV